jgi:hypothetical protein
MFPLGFLSRFELSNDNRPTTNATMKILSRLFTLVSLLTASISSALAGDPANTAIAPFERRCGWFINPTPGNAWLDDRDGEWTIGVQGGRQADGDWPNFADNQWVETNVHYGYGCACLRVRVNRNTLDILQIESAYAQRLAVCRMDPALKEPK